MAAAFDRPDEASRRRSGVTPQRRRCRGFMTHLNRNKHSFQQVELKQQRRRRRLPLELSFTSQKSSRLFTSVSRFSLSRVWCELPGGSPLSCLPFASVHLLEQRHNFPLAQASLSRLDASRGVSLNLGVLSLFVRPTLTRSQLARR